MAVCLRVLVNLTNEQPQVTPKTLGGLYHYLSTRPPPLSSLAWPGTPTWDTSCCEHRGVPHLRPGPHTAFSACAPRSDDESGPMEVQAGTRLSCT